MKAKFYFLNFLFLFKKIISDFKKKSQLDDENNQTENSLPQACLDEDHLISQENKLSSQENENTNENFREIVQCDFPGCEKIYSNKSNMMNHKKITHQNMSFKCFFCNYSSRNYGCNFFLKKNYFVK